VTQSIGKDFKPFYARDRGSDLGVATWPTTRGRSAAARSADSFPTIRTLDLVYYGTASPAPVESASASRRQQVDGGVFARDADTGAARWFYQMNPHDLHAYGGGNENVLVDVDVGGAARKVLLHPDGNGYMYMIDRASGEVLGSNPIRAHHELDRRRRRDRQHSLRGAHRAAARQGRARRCPAPPARRTGSRPPIRRARTSVRAAPDLCQEAEFQQTSYIAGTPTSGADQDATRPVAVAAH
jgi:hypothetical protein